MNNKWTLTEYILREHEECETYSKLPKWARTLLELDCSDITGFEFAFAEDDRREQDLGIPSIWF